MTASKIILVLGLTFGTAVTGSALAMGGDQAAPSPAAGFEAVPDTGAGVSPSGGSPTPPSTPTTAARPSDQLAASPSKVPADPYAPPAAQDHQPGHEDLRPNPYDGPVSASFDFTPASRQQNGGTGYNAADSFAPAPSCSHQCITKGVAYLHGSDVEIVVETSVPAQIFISVTAVIDGDEKIWLDWTSFGHTSHTWLLEDLVPGVTYYVMASATDDHQYTSYAWGEFTLP